MHFTLLCYIHQGPVLYTVLYTLLCYIHQGPVLYTAHYTFLLHSRGTCVIYGALHPPMLQSPGTCVIYSALHPPVTFTRDLCFIRRTTHSCSIQQRPVLYMVTFQWRIHWLHKRGARSSHASVNPYIISQIFCHKRGRAPWPPLNPPLPTPSYVTSTWDLCYLRCTTHSCYIQQRPVLYEAHYTLLCYIYKGPVLYMVYFILLLQPTGTCALYGVLHPPMLHSTGTCVK
jgi:hypothetical protein